MDIKLLYWTVSWYFMVGMHGVHSPLFTAAMGIVPPVFIGNIRVVFPDSCGWPTGIFNYLDTWRRYIRCDICGFDRLWDCSLGVEYCMDFWLYVGDGSCDLWINAGRNGRVYCRSRSVGSHRLYLLCCFVHIFCFCIAITAIICDIHLSRYRHTWVPVSSSYSPNLLYHNSNRMELLPMHSHRDNLPYNRIGL